MNSVLIPVMIKTKQRLTPRRLAASSSVFGSIIASSYRRQETTPMIPVIDIKSAATPNASGAKSLATIGATSTPRPWANTLPVTSFKTLAAKLDDGFDMEAGLSYLSGLFGLFGYHVS